MKKQSSGRNPLFAKRWFTDEVIVMCVRWYLRFRLSYRDLASIICSQLTKAGVLGLRVSGDDIADFYLLFGHHHSVNQELH